MKALAVFCGSKAGADPLYKLHATQLGGLMAAHQVKLIYGGGNVGLMGAVADGVMANGGEVLGIIPELLLAWEAAHNNITNLQVVPDMHIRKKMMYELADAAVILPGGFGTLDELFEMLTWNTLKIHDKHIYILNTNGFYNHLIAHMEQMVRAGFLYEPIENRIKIISNPQEIIPYLTA
jgi:uncharacterized protein (TIGR00730 family)